MSIVPISLEYLARSLAVRDLSDPANGPHAIQLVAESLLEELRTAWNCATQLHRANPIISVHQNYERLRYPAEATTRDERYTRYVDENTVLRTSATSMIPPLLEVIAQQTDVDDILLAPVGLVYRRDQIDRLHVGEPHQLDLWRIRRGCSTDADLEEMIRLVAGVIAPGAPYRTTPAVHAYTLNGREIYALVHSTWVEIGECGLAHPELLRDAGLEPREWSGLAMGIGLDRAVMLRKGLDDIRLLRSDDPRIRSQMSDLSPYCAVSRMPAIRRDLSLAVTPGLDAETIGDRVREELGDRAMMIEDLSILSETPAADLPPQAIERIGIRAGQVNLLVRLVLRHPTETLTDHAANVLRDDVYRVLHEGTVHQWAAAV